MSRIKQSLVFLLGLIGLVSLIGLVTPLSGQGQGGGNQTPLNVSVVNPASDPALVRDVGVPVRTPVQIRVNTLINTGETFGSDEVYTVPAGKRLIIQHVAVVSANISTGNAVHGTVQSRFGGQIFAHPLHLSAQSPVDGPVFVANHPLLAIADAETVVKVSVSADDIEVNFGSYSALFGTLSGYLENVP